MVHSRAPYSVRMLLAGGGPNVSRFRIFGPELISTWKVARVTREESIRASIDDEGIVMDDGVNDR